MKGIWLENAEMPHANLTKKQNQGLGVNQITKRFYSPRALLSEIIIVGAQVQQSNLEPSSLEGVTCNCVKQNGTLKHDHGSSQSRFTKRPLSNPELKTQGLRLDPAAFNCAKLCWTIKIGNSLLF